MSAASTHEAATALELGARGKLRGAPFALTGRTCVRSDAGGLWNEWVVAFDDGREAVLAEALGAFTLFFERPIAPSFRTLLALGVGQPLGTGFVVVERGQAKRVARWGDVPEGPRIYRYADLSSATGERATIDYGATERDRAEVFVGHKLRLSELGLKARRGRQQFVAVPGGPPPKHLTLWLAIGDEGNLTTEAGRSKFRVIGIVQRSIRIESQRYTWEEYVLHAPAEGLRWLILADGHWNLVETVEPGQIEESARGAKYEGALYKPWSSGRARIEWAGGELPWVAKVGDVVEARDYVRAPHMLSCELTPDEITWSRGTYVPPHAIASAFGKRMLPKPSGRAPNEPTASTPRRRGDPMPKRS